MINEVKTLTDVVIREPSLEEFLEIAQFSYINFVNETARSTGEAVSVLMEKYGGPPLDRRKNDIWFLIEKNQKKIGFIWIELRSEEKSSFGYDIFLEDDYRSQGIGRYVMQLCGNELTIMGIDSVKICVFEHNYIARKLYDSLGFKIEKFDEARNQYTLILSFV